MWRPYDGCWLCGIWRLRGKFGALRMVTYMACGKCCYASGLLLNVIIRKNKWWKHRKCSRIQTKLLDPRRRSSSALWQDLGVSVDSNTSITLCLLLLLLNRCTLWLSYQRFHHFRNQADWFGLVCVFHSKNQLVYYKKWMRRPTCLCTVVQLVVAMLSNWLIMIPVSKLNLI